MKRKYIAIILGIIFAGIAIRLFPNILNYAWGNDYGIYYYLSQAFLSGKSLVYPPNSPWGTDGYQYFPVTFLIVDFVHLITGISVAEALDYSIPILGGLTPFLLYLISREIGLDRITSALAGFLLVVSPVQLYQTSQPNYLTTGHFFLLLSIYFFLAYHRKKIFAVPLAISVILLVLSHQLSTYFFLISIVGMVFSVNLLNTKWKSFLFSDMLVIELSGTFMLTYLLLRVPNMVQFFSGAVHGLGYVGVIVLFYSLVLVSYLALRNFNSAKFREKAIRVMGRLKMTIEPRGDLMLVFVASLSIMAILVALIATGTIPRFISYYAVIISLPFIVFLAVSTIGIKYFLIENNIAEVLGWTMAILISLLYSFASKNTVLLPARHIEYLSEPFSIISGYVIVKWYLHFKSMKGRINVREKNTRVRGMHKFGEGIATPIAMNTPAGVTMITMPRQRVTTSLRHYTASARRPFENVVAIAAVSLVLLMGVASYPMVSDFIPSHTEAITLEDNATIQYLVEYGNKSLSVATDHQMGILLYSYGFASPFNNISTLWNSTSWTGAIDEITGQNGSYAPIGYVFLNTFMLQYGVWGYNSSLNPNQLPIMVNGTAFTKFFAPPFVLLYENSSTTRNSTTYLFSLNWTYLGNKGYNLSYYYGLYEKKEGNASAIQLSPTFPAFEQMKAYSPSLSPLSPYFLSLQRQRPCWLSPELPPPVLPQRLSNLLLCSLLF
jgi:hypothetical protein